MQTVIAGGVMKVIDKQTAINNINRLLAKIDAPVGNSDHAKGLAQGYIFACNDSGLITQAESLGFCSQLINRSDNLKIDELSEDRKAFELACHKTGFAYSLFYSNGKYTHDITQLCWEIWQAKSVALVEKKNIESWYLDEYENMYTDEPDNFLCDLEIGSVQAVKRKDYLIIKEQILYAVRPWNKENQEADSWEFYETKEEADAVASHCEKMWNEEEVQELSND